MLREVAWSALTPGPRDYVPHGWGE